MRRSENEMVAEIGSSIVAYAVAGAGYAGNQSFVSERHGPLNTGSVTLNLFSGMAVDAAGSLYIADTSREPRIACSYRWRRSIDSAKTDTATLSHYSRFNEAGGVRLLNTPMVVTF